MGMKSYIRESEVSGHTNLHDLKILESREDVATLIDVYQDVLKQGIPANAITGVKEDTEKHYFFIVSDKRSMFGLDIVTFINNKYNARKVTNSNIILLFPQEISRGLYGEEKKRRPRAKGALPQLYYDRENLMISVPYDGAVVVGRSSKRSNFVINGNESVSRAHLKVFYDKREGCLKLEDCNSAHGTFLNGKRVGRGGAYLEVGDVITFVGEKILVSK